MTYTVYSHAANCYLVLRFYERFGWIIHIILLHLDTILNQHYYYKYVVVEFLKENVGYDMVWYRVLNE